ncbi:hypothetical protein GT039_23670 [Streptomyces sp. SID2955]|nr:hypothetical protein [Streptomyces sp. SID2955]
MGDTAARAAVGFHIFTSPARGETEAALAALRAGGVTGLPLQPPGAPAEAEAVLAGTAEVATLAGALTGLLHRLRHGLEVRAAGPRDLVVRCGADVPQGLVLVRGQETDTEVREPVSLAGPLRAVLAELVHRPPGVHPRSVLFDEWQNQALAAEAARATHVFADPDFVRGADPTGRLLDDPEPLTRIATRPRLLLDLLLLAHAMSPTDGGDPHASDVRPPGAAEAQRLASTVEAFVPPSTDPRTRRLRRPLPGGGHGFLIAVPPVAVDLMVNLCWVLPAVCGVPGGSAGDPERLRGDVDDMVASYLTSWRPGRTGTVLPPRPVIPQSRPPGVAPHDPEDPVVVFDACAQFLIARELMPLLTGGAGEDGPGSALPAFTAGLPREAAREAAADSAAYVLTVNALVLGSTERPPRAPDIANVRRHFHEERPSRLGRTRRLRRQAREDGLMMARSVLRATEALLAYYAVADIFAALARARGDSALARHLETVADRRETVWTYATWVRREGFPESWGLRTWHEGEDEVWGRLQEYVRHVQRDLVPAVVGGRGA